MTKCYGFIWKLGQDMETLKEEVKWGSHFYKNLSEDLKNVLPGVKSFSPRNLLYMNQFYRLFPNTLIAKQVVSQTDEMMKNLIQEIWDSWERIWWL